MQVWSRLSEPTRCHGVLPRNLNGGEQRVVTGSGAIATRGEVSHVHIGMMIPIIAPLTHRVAVLNHSLLGARGDGGARGKYRHPALDQVNELRDVATAVTVAVAVTAAI